MGMSKSDKRAFAWILAALATTVVLFVLAFFLVNMAGSAARWVGPLLTTLPAIVLTLYVPALRDLSRRVRALAFVVLSVGLSAGFANLSLQFAGDLSAEELLPVVAMGLLSLGITAMVAFVDWRPEAGPRTHEGAAEAESKPWVGAFLVIVSLVVIGSSLTRSRRG